MTIQTWKGKTRMCYCAKNKGGKEGKNLKKENEGEKAFFENILAEYVMIYTDEQGKKVIPKNTDSYSRLQLAKIIRGKNYEDTGTGTVSGKRNLATQKLKDLKGKILSRGEESLSCESFQRED